MECVSVFGHTPTLRHAARADPTLGMSVQSLQRQAADRRISRTAGDLACYDARAMPPRMPEGGTGIEWIPPAPFARAWRDLRRAGSVDRCGDVLEVCDVGLRLSYCGDDRSSDQRRMAHHQLGPAVPLMQKVSRSNSRASGSLILYGRPPELGVDLDNSPGHLRNADITGKVIVQTTTAGTAGALAARHAAPLLCASFVNASATARYLKAAHEIPVTFVITGSDGQAEEDLACADYIATMPMRPLRSTRRPSLLGRPSPMPARNSTRDARPDTRVSMPTT